MDDVRLTNASALFVLFNISFTGKDRSRGGARQSGEGQTPQRHESWYHCDLPARAAGANRTKRCFHRVVFAAEAERLLRLSREQLEVAKREVVMFKRHANQAPPQQQQQQHVNLSHISQPLLNSYIGSAIRYQ
jgi:hypothetical protein